MRLFDTSGVDGQFNRTLKTFLPPFMTGKFR